MNLTDLRASRVAPGLLSFGLAIVLAAAEHTALAQGAPPPPAPPPLAPEAERAPEVEPVGTVHLVLFLEDHQAAAGARVELPDGRETVTASDGSAWVQLPGGSHRIEITRPGSTESQSIEVPVIVEEVTTAIFTFAADGTIGVKDVLVADEARVSERKAPEKTGPPGTLRGRVFSADDGSPVEGARIYVAGYSADATTNAEGNFELTLPEGTHTLSVIHTKFSTQTVDAVQVKANETTTIEVEITPVSLELDDFVVTAPHVRGGVAAVMDTRRTQAAVSDAVGAEDIAKMPASDAAQAAQRVVGATIVGGRFVYVRGLGERYSNALLNGAPLPSPEPDRATVPLDLFPAKLLDSLDISKTFTPDVPGDFAGGSVRIVTRSVPEEPIFNVSLSAGYNSESTLREGFGQRASSTDWLGFDDGMRALSPAVPEDYQLRRGFPKPDGSSVGREELNEQAPNLNSPMDVKNVTLPPSLSGSILWGRGWKLGADRRLGVVTSLLYSRSFNKREQELREFLDTALQPAIEYEDVETTTDSVRWGAFASGTFEISKEHKIALLGMHSQLSDATTDVFFDGFSQNTQEQVGASRMTFASRGLTLGQLRGDHILEFLNEAQLEWALSLSHAARDEPDTRDTVYTIPQGQEQYQFLNSTDSGRHFFSEMGEDARFLKLDWTQPVTDGDIASRIKLGSMVTLKDRQFRARRFNLLPSRGAPSDAFVCGPQFDPISCPAELLVDDNIPSLLTLNEDTRIGDSYNAVLNIYAGYLMADVGLGEHLRFIAGARVEQTEQTVVAYDPFGEQEIEDSGSDLRSLDLLPAASIVVSPTEEMNVRVAVSRTIARPQLRELAPFAFSAYFGGDPLSGNPDLTLTGIVNGDLRYEYFPSPSEVLAVSVFAKSFTDPIEPQVIPGGSIDTLTFLNADGALLYGAEFEARKSLDFLVEALEDFTLIASLMLADSQIEVEQTMNMVPTNTERRLVQQAPYVVNLAIDYDGPTDTQVRLLYNVSGPTIVEVGTRGLDDVYQHPRHQLDLSAAQTLFEGFKLRLVVRNMLNAEYLLTQGPEDQGNNVRRRYLDGISASLGASYSF